MLHFAVTALLAFAIAMNLDLPVAGATTISTDLYISQFCAGCTQPINDTIKTDVDGLIDIQTTAYEFTACESDGETYCGDLGDSLRTEAEAEIIKSTHAQLGSETSNLESSAKYRDEYQENSGCSYFESKLGDPQRVREECRNVEPGSDDLGFVNVLTLTTVSVISFALLAGVWLLHRSFRNWQLRNIIARAKTISNLQVRKDRRRSSRPIRGVSASGLPTKPGRSAR